MTLVSRSSFNFEGFTVSKSTFECSSSSTGVINIDIEPSGEIKENVFLLKLIVKVEDDVSSFKIYLACQGTFTFNEKIDNEVLEGYFFNNAPAIVFPYIRAYITTLTANSGCNIVVVLPTLNLSDLTDILKENTKIII